MMEQPPPREKDALTAEPRPTVSLQTTPPGAKVGLGFGTEQHEPTGQQAGTLA